MTVPTKANSKEREMTSDEIKTVRNTQDDTHSCIALDARGDTSSGHSSTDATSPLALACNDQWHL